MRECVQTSIPYLLPSNFYPFLMLCLYSFYILFHIFVYLILITYLFINFVLIIYLNLYLIVIVAWHNTALNVLFNDFISMFCESICIFNSMYEVKRVLYIISA